MLQSYDASGSGRAARRMARSMFTGIIDTNRNGLVSLEEFRHTCTNNNIRGLLFPF